MTFAVAIVSAALLVESCTGIVVGSRTIKSKIAQLLGALET